MHTQSIEAWQHRHVFLGESHARRERRTWLVVALTAGMMVAEIAAGWVFGSMALTADGWHMSTHAAALGIAAMAYRFARTHAQDPRFSFGTGKVGELAGFSSALILAMIALLIAYESALRLTAPVPIHFNEAILVAVIGLVVNLASVWLLSEPHHHGHGQHDHAHDDDGHHSHAHAAHHHHHHHHDSNARGALLHVMADAFTSVLAIAALLAGRLYGWNWLDPVIGIVGALVIARWSWGLIRSAGAVLLDMQGGSGIAAAIRERLEVRGDRIADLHLWRVGPGHLAAIVSLVSDRPLPPGDYKRLLAGIGGLSHVTVEVHRCADHLPVAA